MDATSGTNSLLTRITDHFDGTRFFNPQAPRPRTLAEVRRWRRERRKEPWPARVEDPILPAPSQAASDRIAATFIGHSTFLLQIGGVRVLTDPIWSERCSPVSFAGPRRARRPGQSLDSLPGVDIVLVTHNHYDHMDLPTLRQIRTRWTPRVVTGLANARHLAKAKIRSAIELDWWDSVTLAGTRVTYVPAQHFSSRGLYDRDRCLWGGFVIEAGGAVVYFAEIAATGPHSRGRSDAASRASISRCCRSKYEPRWFMSRNHIDSGGGGVQARISISAHAVLSGCISAPSS